MSRVSKNTVFLNPERYWPQRVYEKIYVTQSLEKFVRDFASDRKNTDRLSSNVVKIGYPEKNLCVAGADNSTLLASVTKTKIEYRLFKSPDSKPLVFVKHVTPMKVSSEFKEFENALIDGKIGTGAMLMLDFLLFVDIERVQLNPGEKHKPKKYQPVKNDTSTDFLVADINWGRDIERNTPFAVRGHYRLQRVGPGKQMIKVIYIEPFQKKGYYRKAGKKNL